MIKLACATLSIEGFGETDFAGVFGTAPKIGFRHIEFNCWYPSSLAPAAITSLRERCAKAGLSAIALHLGGGLGGDVTKDFCHKLRAMQAVRELGGGLVVTSGLKRGEDGGLQGVIRSLKAIAPAAEELGVAISLENHYDNNLESLEDYRRVFSEIASPNVGLCVDTGHFEASGVDIFAVAEEFFPRINHIHLKENKTPGQKSFARFGEGATDNIRFVREMAARGYSGYMTVELSPEIGETGGRPFTLADLELPFKMFSPLERD